MIPKVLHFCWFGHSQYPERLAECISSWARVMPDYEIVRWDESNFDVSSHPYVSEAYKMKLWAFVSDYARLSILKHHGGIYLDTDVLALKPLDQFLHHELFLGMMFSDSVGTAVIGSRPNNSHVTALLRAYDDMTPGGHPNNDLFTGYLIDAFGRDFLLGNRLQIFADGTAVYPKEYFERATADPRRGFTRHLAFGSWNGANGEMTAKARFASRFIGPVGWSRLQNLRTIPRAMHFSRYLQDLPRSLFLRQPGDPHRPS